MVQTKRFITAAFRVMLLSLTAVLPAQNQEAHPWTAPHFRIVDKPGEIVEKLPNGMVAIVRENRTAPVAAVRLYVRAGSIYEQNRLGAGLSHLFEHLLMAGETKNRTEQESLETIERIGAQYNAFTGKARTCYYLTVPAQHVGTALNLVADWVTRPTFPEEAFQRERGVVQRELEMYASDPERIMHYLSDEIRYQVHPARYPIIGYQNSLRELTNQEIIDYYNTMYVPENCVISVAGDINADEMLDAIRKEFSDFLRRSPPHVVLPEEPDIVAPREVVKVVPSLRGPAKLQIAFPSFKLQHPDLYALDTLASIMGEGKSSRLYQRLREKDKLVYNVTAYNYTPDWAKGTFAIVCELEQENIPAVRQIVREEIDRLAAEGVTDDELVRAVRNLQVDHIQRNQTAQQQASNMAEDYLASGEPHFSEHYVANMEKVDAAGVQAMAGKYLMPDRQMTLILVGQPLAASATANARGRDAGEIKKITLDNGLRILIKRNPAVPLVSTQLYVAGGLVNETAENNGITNMMVNLSSRGTKDYSAEQIVNYFDSIGADFQADCGNHTFYYQLETMPRDFVEAMDYFSQIVMLPTFPEAELNKLRPAILATIQQQENSWQWLSLKFFREMFYEKSPYQRMKLGTQKSVSTISREDIDACHQQAVVGSRAVLAVFGDIDAGETEQLLRKKFAFMIAGEPLELKGVNPEPKPEKPRQFVRETEKEGAALYVGFSGMKLTNVKDRYPMDVVAQIVGSHTGWLFEQLRGKGLVYYAMGYNFPALTPGFFAATAQCEAAKVPQVLEIVTQQLDRASRGEFTSDEVSRAKSKLINSNVLSRQTSAEAAQQAALDEVLGFGYDWSQGYAERILAITTAEVQRVAKEYLAVSPAVTIITSQPDIVNDENK